MMIREPSEERGSFRSIPRDDKRVDTVSGSFPIRTGSKVNLQESAKTLEQQQSEALVMISGSMTKFPAAPRHGSMLSSLKAQYRKLRTFKGTIRALINLKRSPLLNTVKTTTPAVPSLNDDQRSAVLEVPRISATAASTVQTQVHKLVADGHVVAEIDSTLGTEVAYRQQGNLDLYTKDNLAKRVSLQQHPHMIALTQRLWNCALRNGDKKLTFPDYETYMLCLHRLILPEFDIGASKELIRDDWKRDSGEQNYLDYPFFHLSMFELVDLWTDTVDPDDFRRFIARFGPLELSLSKLVACFCVNRELVPWFHGEIGRDEAESVLSTRERSDGAFLVRFSESHPTKFTLTYLKVHSASSNTPGRRELKNCLVNNLGMTGYALTEAVRRGGAGSSVRQRTYPSIGAFIQSGSGRLKYGVASEFSATCNQELAMVRAMQDQQSDSYAAFSTESLGNPEPPANAAAMLFSRTPPSQSSFLNMPPFNTNTSNTSGAISDSYTSFTLDSLAPPTVHRVEIPANAPPSCQYEDKKLGHGNWSDGNVASASGPFASGDYGSFASFAQQLQPEEEAQPTAAQGSRSTDSPLHHLHRPPAAVSDEYASFANLASTYPHESAARAQEATTFSRSPPSTIQSGFANTGAYGSFASVAVSKPTAASVNPPDSGNPREHAATDDYGSFASLADELEDKRPQWEQTLGPPPPPMVKKSSFDTTKASSSTDVYGDFAALSLAGNGASTHKGQAPAAPNSDVYGSFDPTASSPATKTTPTTSALDELNVGMEFYKQKRLDDALLRFMLAQEMARATGDQVVEARALGNLGTVYLDKKNSHQAVRCYQHCLDITRAIEDTKRERTILNNLVLALVASEDFERALACCQVQLETTTNAINRSKIISRMSLLREKMARQTTS
ncbi:hypothetical protein JG688_00001688 [Phytophthora aleatoria]|uniref:SH2 domain-containing protein n=1 Tax=Phytophthora aleatoria TaxID=2496075 RepID=A0A8J5IVM4_9STRA|nr:hypothetical protein JG688_00001688 [Phytophthora aleatoria]